MNDFEHKLRQQPFRTPPPDLRETLFGSDAEAQKIAVLSKWTWRDCLWPSHKAWAALAALWLIFAAVSAMQWWPGSANPSIATQVPNQDQTTPNLLTYHAQSDHVFDLAN